MCAGRPVWRWLWWQEVEWEKVAKDRLAEADRALQAVIDEREIV